MLENTARGIRTGPKKTNYKDMLCLLYGGEDMKKYVLTAEELMAVLQESFQNDESFPLEVTGWSMRPLLRHSRDTVWLRPFCVETCQRGSILLYQRPNGHLVLHRVRKCLPDGYRMNGDAQLQCEMISREQILAQADQICRGDRLISCSALKLRIWDALWYPTRPIRPLLFHMGHRIKKTIGRE